MFEKYLQPHIVLADDVTEEYREHKQSEKREIISKKN